MRSHFILALIVAGCGFNETQKPDPSKTPFGTSTGPVLNGEAISNPSLIPPISGGTMLISRDGKHTYASDPDLGTVDVITWSSTNQTNQTITGSKTWTFDVGGEGAEPGRLAEDPQGLVYVVLRNRGQVATLDVTNNTVVNIRKVCPAPRGIASNGTSMVIACQGGELMNLPFASGDATMAGQLDTDLRDVIPTANGLFVSRFRSAELLQIANGAMTAKSTPWVAEDYVTDPLKPTVTVEYARYTPEVAWRTVEGPDGSLYSVHLFATTRTVPTVRNPARPVPYYGGSGGSFSGGTARNPCFSGGGVVLTAVTRFINGKASGTVVFPFATPAVDIAVSPNGDTVALAMPGSTTTLSAGSYGSSGTFPHQIVTLPTVNFESEVPTCFSGSLSTLSTNLTGEPVAVGYLPSGQLVVQTREPGMIVAPHTNTGVNGAYPTQSYSSVPLSDTKHDSGFTMFHESTGSNIACMSCHPEGGDDGHTWHFDLGFRRTQSIRGGILSTAPFHWSGDQANMTVLAHDVFSERMGGGTMSDDQTNVLASWVNRIPSIPSRSTLDMAAVARGQTIFAKADCGSCHSGEKLTNNDNRDVGTGQKFQVPSLLGVAARAPYMHDGCAPDLMARFTNTKCGGTDHGKVSGLTASELSDLVSYVESL